MSTLKERWYKHVYAATIILSNNAIGASIRKHGEQAFTIVLLKASICTQEIADQIESDYILAYKSNNPELGYNRTTGGNTPGVVELTQEAKDKISHVNKGRILSKRRQIILDQAKPIVELFKQGMSTIEIANNLQVSRQFVTSRLHKWKKYVEHDLPVGKEHTYKNQKVSSTYKRTHSQLSDRDIKILQLFQSGCTRKQIAIQLGLNYDTVKQIIRRYPT